MVKLVNFFEFSSLNNLRQLMGADLIKEFKFDTGISLLDEDFIKRLNGDGVEIESLDEIDLFRDDKTLTCKGQRVLIYIRDVNIYGQDRELPKYHISSCRTLVDMWRKKRSERYVIQNREDGIFQVRITKDGRTKVQHEKLNVCRNCLANLNWQDYSEREKSHKNRIVADFLIADFFKKFPKSLLSVTPIYNADTAPLNDYTSNWLDISKNAKLKVGYRCQNQRCQINLTGNGQYLHVHHIDGQKNNNKKHNLKVLCVKCHADEPNHGHMKQLPDYKKFVSIYDKLRESVS